MEIGSSLISSPVGFLLDRVENGNVPGMNNGGFGLTIDRDPFFDQHHRDVIDNRIEDLSIGPEKAAG